MDQIHGISNIKSYTLLGSRVKLDKTTCCTSQTLEPLVGKQMIWHSFKIHPHWHTTQIRSRWKDVAGDHSLTTSGTSETCQYFRRRTLERVCGFSTRNRTIFLSMKFTSIFCLEPGEFHRRLIVAWTEPTWGASPMKYPTTKLFQRRFGSARIADGI